ncbi:hypothetical protein NYY91_04485 [Acinetobacter baumannii]|nr:hypothetical protein [Acinetobacter baumannii]
MAISFVSNKKATVTIADPSGYKGAQDFVFNADIANNVYLNASKQRAVISEILSTVRNGQAQVILDSEMTLGSVAVNELRRSYIFDHDTFGVASDRANSNRMSGNNIVLSDADANRYYALYSLKGSVTVSAANAKIIKGSGTLADPLIFQYLNTQTIPVIKSADAKDIVCCSTSPYNTVDMIPYVNLNITDEQITVASEKIGKAQGTIVFKYVEPKRRAAATTTGFKTILTLYADANNYFALVKEATGYRVRYVRNGAQIAFSQITADSTNPVETVALSWNKGVIVLLINGVMYQNTGTPGIGADFIASYARILSANTHWGTISPCAALTNLVTYDRALTFEEMKKASW